MTTTEIPHLFDMRKLDLMQEHGYEHVMEELASSGQDEETDLHQSVRKLQLSIDMLQALKASDGWKIIEAFLQEQFSLRLSNGLLEPLHSLSAAPEVLGNAEYMKGECAAFRLILFLPDNLIADAVAEKAMLMSRLEDEKLMEEGINPTEDENLLATPIAEGADYATGWE